MVYDTPYYKPILKYSSTHWHPYLFIYIFFEIHLDTCLCNKRLFLNFHLNARKFYLSLLLSFVISGICVAYNTFWILIMFEGSKVVEIWLYNCGMDICLIWYIHISFLFLYKNTLYCSTITKGSWDLTQFVYLYST